MPPSDSEPWGQVPELTAMFLLRPEDAVPTLEEMIRNGSSLVPFFISLPWPELSMESMNTMSDTGLPVLVAEIFGDRSRFDFLYDFEMQMEHPVAYDNRVLVLAQSLTTITSFARYWISAWHPNDRPAVIEPFCAALPNVWGMMWRHKDFFLLGPNCQVVAELLEAYLAFNEVLRSQAADFPIAPYAAHVAYHLWYHLWFQDLQRAQSCADYAWRLARKRTESERILFYQEVVPATVEDESLVDFVWRVLAQDSSLLGVKLAYTLDIIMCSIRHSDLPHGVPAVRHRSLIKATATAARREFCQGDVLACPAGMAARVAFSVIGATHKRFKEEAGRDLVDNLLELNFIPEISQAMVWVFKDNDASAIHIIKLYVVALTLYASRGPLRATRLLKRLIQIFWLPTLNVLRAAQRPPSRGADVTSAASPLNYAVKLWKDLGEAYHLTEALERVRLARNNFESEYSAEEQLLGCSTVDCPCHGCEPLHGRMRVCKRCWRAVYCGPRCQKRDWDRRHKDICRQRNSAQQ